MARRRNAGVERALKVKELEVQDNVITLHQQRSLSIDEKRGVNEEGIPYLWLVIPMPQQDDMILDISFLLALPNLTEPFSTAL
jgi:hypothetical protein